MRNCLFLTAVVAIVSTGSPVWAQFDKIFDASGRPREGTIVRMTPSQVVMKEKGGTRDVAFDVNTIRSLSFADEPTELNNARDRIRQGNFESALEELKKINVNEITRDVVKQDVQYFTAFVEGKLALAGTDVAGGKAGAKAKLFAFIGANRGTYHFFPAAELLGDLAMSLEEYPDAVRFYSSLANSESPDLKLKGAVLSARALLQQQNYAEALTRFDAVLTQAGDSPEANRQKLFAQIGRAVCLAETGKPDEGARIIDDIIAKNDPRDTELFGRAYNAQGRSLLKSGKKEDALLAYLHTDLMFNKTPEVHAEALYYLSKLWADVNQADRAVRARTFLGDYYGGSAWAKRQ